MPYELHGWGSDLAIEVSGPDVVTCCAAAVEAFATSFVSVPPSARRRLVDVMVEADEPAGLLAELLEEAILRLDAHGEVAVGLAQGTARTGRPGRAAGGRRPGRRRADRRGPQGSDLARPPPGAGRRRLGRSGRAGSLGAR